MDKHGDTQPARHIVSIRYETYFHTSGRLSHAYRHILYSDGSIDFAALSADEYKNAIAADASTNSDAAGDDTGHGET